MDVTDNIAGDWALIQLHVTDAHFLPSLHYWKQLLWVIHLDRGWGLLYSSINPPAALWIRWKSANLRWINRSRLWMGHLMARRIMLLHRENARERKNPISRFHVFLFWCSFVSLTQTQTPKHISIGADMTADQLSTLHLINGNDSSVIQRFWVAFLPLSLQGNELHSAEDPLVLKLCAAGIYSVCRGGS